MVDKQQKQQLKGGLLTRERYGVHSIDITESTAEVVMVRHGDLQRKLVLIGCSHLTRVRRGRRR